MAEFLGMTIFEIYGGNAPNSVAAYGNGITLGILGKSLQSTLDRMRNNDLTEARFGLCTHDPHCC